MKVGKFVTIFAILSLSASALCQVEMSTKARICIGACMAANPGQQDNCTRTCQKKYGSESPMLEGERARSICIAGCQLLGRLLKNTCITKCNHRYSAVSPIVGGLIPKKFKKKIKRKLCYAACTKLGPLAGLCRKKCAKKFRSANPMVKGLIPKKFKKKIKKKLCYAACTKLGPLAGVCRKKCAKKFGLSQSPSPFPNPFPSPEQIKRMKFEACIKSCNKLASLDRGSCRRKCEWRYNMKQLTTPIVGGLIPKKFKKKIKKKLCYAACTKLGPLAGVCRKKCAKKFGSQMVTVETPVKIDLVKEIHNQLATLAL